MAPIEDDPGLPRVLLIGDSISIGYTVRVRELLKGKANVHRAPVNCQGTTAGLTGTRGAKSWLGEGKWDVIHFNFGIWDAKIQPATGNPATQTARYVQNLVVIADRLQETGAKVVFATTTPIPDCLTSPPLAPGSTAPDTRLFVPIPDRNSAAIEAMEGMGVAINDLYAVIFPQRENCWNPNDLHFSAAGSEILARAVAQSIEALLPKTEPGAQ